NSSRERLQQQLLALEIDLGRLARDLWRQRVLGRAVDAGDGQQLGLEALRIDARRGVAARAGNRLAAQRRVDVDAAVGDDLGAVADQGQHDEVAALGIDL